jgi:FkbM family methyltransferase
VTRSHNHREFREALFGDLVRDLYSTHATKGDRLRFAFGPRERVAIRLKDAMGVTIDKLGFTRQPRRLDHVATQLLWLVESADRFGGINDALADPESRALWGELIRFRALGPRRVRLRRNSRSYWRLYNTFDRRFLRERNTREALGRMLNLYEVPGRDGPIRLHSNPRFILNTFVLQQYAYEGTTAAVRAEDGDVVIDGGGGWGDTALHFADQVGPAGKVHCFEFVRENLEILRENLRLNPQLEPRVVLHANALWRRSGESLPYENRGPGSSVVHGNRAGSVETVTIDDFVAREQLDRVSFVKLDIEDAEEAALEGAATTIARWKPKLAVAIYHSNEQFIAVPERIRKLEPSYRLFVDHLTTHTEETILYAST